MVIFLGKSYSVIQHTLSISLFSGAKESVYLKCTVKLTALLGKISVSDSQSTITLYEN